MAAMLAFLSDDGPTRRQLGKCVKCVACRSRAIRFVWLWGRDVAVTLCDDGSAAHLKVKAAEGRPADFDFLADVGMTLSALNEYVAQHPRGQRP